MNRQWLLCLALGALALGSFTVRTAYAQSGAPDTLGKEVRASAEQLAKAFDAGKAADLSALFAPQGEYVDESGAVYSGRDDIKTLFTKFFAKFPGATLAIEIESIRALGPNLAIEEGTRHVVAKDKARAQMRYVAVRNKVEGQWLIASFREFSDDPIPTPHENLQGLAWLIGDWVNEGSDGTVKVSYRWSEDQNYILANYAIQLPGKPPIKSEQRIGWDAHAGAVRSWFFESDGGFAEGVWTPTETGWIVKSTTVSSDGQAGSATMTFSTKGKDHFIIKGTDRVLGGEKVEDFEFTVAKKVGADKPKEKPVGAIDEVKPVVKPPVLKTPAVPGEIKKPAILKPAPSIKKEN